MDNRVRRYLFIKIRLHLQQQFNHLNNSNQMFFGFYLRIPYGLKNHNTTKKNIFNNNLKEHDSVRRRLHMVYVIRIYPRHLINMNRLKIF